MFLDAKTLEWVQDGSLDWHIITMGVVCNKHHKLFGMSFNGPYCSECMKVLDKSEYTLVRRDNAYKLHNIAWAFIPKYEKPERHASSKLLVKYFGPALFTGDHFTSVARYLLNCLPKLTLSHIDGSYLLLMDSDVEMDTTIPIEAWLKLYRIKVGLSDEELITFTYEVVTDVPIKAPELPPTSFCLPSDLYLYARQQIPDSVENILEDNSELSYQEVMFDLCNDITLADLDTATYGVSKGLYSD